MIEVIPNKRRIAFLHQASRSFGIFPACAPSQPGRYRKTLHGIAVEKRFAAGTNALFNRRGDACAILIGEMMPLRRAAMNSRCNHFLTTKRKLQLAHTGADARYAKIYFLADSSFK
ncbi:MAG TPA: hypothetical protein VF472_01845 [Burkholderiaceae bacterium]